MEIDSAEKYRQLAQQERDYFHNMVKLVKDSGANLVLCQWGFDDEANHLLMQADLPAVRWVGGLELEVCCARDINTWRAATWLIQ